MPYINEDSIKVGCVFKQKNDPAYNGKKIKFSIEKDNQFLVLDSFNLYGSGEYYKETDVLNVEKGDKIFFRIFDDGNEIVKNIDWKCYAYYVNKDTALTDADNKKIYKFESDEDYTATYKTGISPDFSGEINISGSITAPALSDTVILKILKNDIIVYTDTFPYAIAINDSVNFNINADTLDVFKFYFYSNTQVEWSAVHAHLKMSFLQDGKTINIYPNIEYNLFQNDIFPSNPSYLDVDTRIPELYIKFKAQTTHASDLIFSDKDVFYNYEEKIHINQGLSDTLLSIYTYIPENTPIYFDIYTTDKDLANNIEFAKVMLVFYTSDYSNPDTVYYPVGLHTVYSDSMQFLFGNLNRGWGQFAYSPENHSLPIQDSLLKMTDSLILANAFNALSDTNVVHDFPIDTTNMESIESGMGNLGNLITEHGLTLPFNQIFRNMIFDPQSNEWKDVCGLAILSKNKASIGLPSFFDDIDFSELDVPNDSISDEVETLSPEEITMEVPGP
ncbi:MAG: hypothetical protein GX259_11205, partial [Bacteroidales bacterium]|nr:hypothetical protein [Bacteroidales bacterium]